MSVSFCAGDPSAHPKTTIDAFCHSKSADASSFAYSKTAAISLIQMKSLLYIVQIKLEGKQNKNDLEVHDFYNNSNFPRFCP